MTAHLAVIFICPHLIIWNIYDTMVKTYIIRRAEMRILGVDFGDSRTGFAISDVMGFGANVLEAFKCKSLKGVAEYTAELAKQQGAEKIVIGYPKNMNGTLGPRAEKTKRLAGELEKLLDIPIILRDERLTTVSAHNLMNETNVRGKKRKESVDSISAAYILQGYLDSIRNETESERS